MNEKNAQILDSGVGYILKLINVFSPPNFTLMTMFDAFVKEISSSDGACP